jgi:hypothetical protein
MARHCIRLLMRDCSRDRNRGGGLYRGQISKYDRLYEGQISLENYPQNQIINDRQIDINGENISLCGITKRRRQAVG